MSLNNKTLSIECKLLKKTYFIYDEKIRQITNQKCRLRPAL